MHPSRVTARRVPVALFCAALLALSACGDNDGTFTAESTIASVADATADESTPDVDSEPAETDSAETDSSGADEASSGADSTDTAAATGAANTAEVVAAADALIATLSDDQVSSLILDFSDSSVVSEWSNLPACGDSARPGIGHGDLSDEQVAAVLGVVDATLSDGGYEEYVQIIAADDVLGSDSSGPGGNVWNSDCYYLAFYGTPSESEAFGLMFGGHHYARIITYDDGTATITPAFTGVEPKTFEYEGVDTAPMADEVDGIFAIFAAFDDAQQATAEIDGAFDDVLMGPGSDSFPETIGLVGSELTDDQRAAAVAAIETWVGDFDASVSEPMMATIEAELDETYFSWASTIDPEAEGAYARIDGPTIWVEVVNQAGVGTDDIHHHSIYRDKSNDYGDLG